MKKVVTLNQFIIERQYEIPEATGGFSRLLHHLAIAAKKVNREVNKAGLVDLLGRTGEHNIQGEEQQKLDLYANETFLDELRASGECCGAASEENEDTVIFDEGLHREARYIVCMDPLDGSSNIDVNVSVGTIFAIYKRLSAVGGPAEKRDFLQPGSALAAAGYVIYGSSTMLVYSSGRGVDGFTLDPSIGEFCLSHPALRFPADGRIYSINEGNYVKFPAGVKRYIKYCQQHDPRGGRPYTSRYIGSLVADIHRNLLKGGIYIYPQTESHPHGKLRLQYECSPMAYLVEQAGGRATDGVRRILDIAPQDIHQRTPFYAGSERMMERAEEHLRIYGVD